MGKVRFGLENVHYSIVTEGSFGTPKALTGAVNLSIDPEGDDSTFYADNIPYATFTTNAGYSGSIEIACLEDEAASDLLSDTVDSNGLVYEVADAQPKEIALLFEIGGNVKNQRFALYSCTMSRPSREANTTSDSTDPDTITLDFKAVPKVMTIGTDSKKVTKATIERTTANATIYDAWFTTVQLPSGASGVTN